MTSFRDVLDLEITEGDPKMTYIEIESKRGISMTGIRKTTKNPARVVARVAKRSKMMAKNQNLMDGVKKHFIIMHHHLLVWHLHR